MNYNDTKIFQEYLFDKSFDILNKISNFFSEDMFKEAWEYIDSESCFKAVIDKMIGHSIENIIIKDIDIQTIKFDNCDLELFLNESIIKYLKISIPYNGTRYGVEIKTTKKICEKESYKFDTRITILGDENFVSYSDDYDLRYHPITLSKNPYNIFFLHSDFGLLNVHEYITEYKFDDFPLDYNKWGEDEFIQQKLTI